MTTRQVAWTISVCCSGPTEITLPLRSNDAKRSCALHTKYKAAEAPADAEIYQVVAYAEIRGCHDAVLVNPSGLDRPLDQSWGGIHLRSMTFAVDRNLEEAG